MSYIHMSKYFDILRSLYMHLEDFINWKYIMQIYIQNPCHPEISLVLITLCPRNIILVYLAVTNCHII